MCVCVSTGHPMGRAQISRQPQAEGRHEQSMYGHRQFVLCTQGSVFSADLCMSCFCCKPGDTPALCASVCPRYLTLCWLVTLSWTVSLNSALVPMCVCMFTIQMKKVYFIAVESQAPYRIRMDSVYCFEGATRTLTHHPVPVPDNCHDPVLRIRYVTYVHCYTHSLTLCMIVLYTALGHPCFGHARLPRK